MAPPQQRQPTQAWTIGHWTLPEPDFLRPLHEHEIVLIADVRSLPGSRRSPQFNQEEMPRWLSCAGIDYIHLPDLGGRRNRQPVDPDVNAGWRQRSFKNYADYTLDPAYERGIQRLEGLASIQRTAILCGEPLPWRCHRLLIANTLTVRGWTVWHLIGGASPLRHELGRWGATPRIGTVGELTYPTDR